MFLKKVIKLLRWSKFLLTLDDLSEEALIKVMCKQIEDQQRAFLEYASMPIYYDMIVEMQELKFNLMMTLEANDELCKDGQEKDKTVFFSKATDVFKKFALGWYI